MGEYEASLSYYADLFLARVRLGGRRRRRWRFGFGFGSGGVVGLEGEERG